MDDNKQSNIKWIAVTALAVVVVLAVVFLLPKTSAPKYKNLDVFAQCLTEKGAKMYGAYWCSHCKAQKAMFGESFKYIDYIECTESDKIQVCKNSAVEAYPTWKIASTTLTGEVALEKLAEVSGCVLETK